MSTDEIRRAYREASGKWTGCDWRTEFGATCLNLNGLKASQAILLARATSGREAADWRAAAEWLDWVEHDARTAQVMAAQALALAHDRKTIEAFFHVQSACAIEAKYHIQLVWQPLCEAIETALTGVM